MNYGAEPADQVVRYTLEGTEFALKISGTAAKNFAVFALAVLRDQKKTHVKTQACSSAARGQTAEILQRADRPDAGFCQGRKIAWAFVCAHP